MSKWRRPVYFPSMDIWKKDLPYQDSKEIFMDTWIDADVEFGDWEEKEYNG